ncbi:MAG: single-stranded DNA-binding protein [Ruminococcaceae bacterium]|nr:single-stranded DNA-binding protein [Oscillospiraceae bacterium]
MLNKVILMGRFTRDPELRSTPQGVSTCSFSIAVDRNFVRQGEERKADFINCVAWRQTAEFISKYFKKGSMVALEGSIQTRSWDDNDGKKRYATEVIVSQVYFAESKRDSQTPFAEDSFASNDFGSLPEPISPMGTDDDLPF